MNRTDANITIVIRDLPPDAPIATLGDRLKAVMEMFPAPDLQVDAGGVGSLLLERLRPLGAKALDKFPRLTSLVRPDGGSYAEQFVSRYAELIARRVQVERAENGDAVVAFSGRREVVPMGQLIDAETALRNLSRAVERVMQHVDPKEPINEPD